MTARTSNASETRSLAECYPGERGQPRLVRAAVAMLVEGCPRADDAILIASELATNAVVHSNSAAPGGQFTVRVEVCCSDYVWIEVQDQGGPWVRGENDDGPIHGLDLVNALAAAGNWGIEGDAEHGRIVWARLDWHYPGIGEHRVAGQPGLLRHPPLTRDLGTVRRWRADESGHPHSRPPRVDAVWAARCLRPHRLLALGTSQDSYVLPAYDHSQAAREFVFSPTRTAIARATLGEDACLFGDQ